MVSRLRERRGNLPCRNGARLSRCSPTISLEEPWAGFQTGKTWLFRSYGGVFKVAKNDGKQGTPYGTSFGRGSNVTAIRHNDSCLEFAVNGHSQGIITLQTPMPSDVVGCVSMCTQNTPVAMSLHGGPIPQPIPQPPKLPQGTVKLAACDNANKQQRFVYDSEGRAVRAYNSQCLVLPQTTLGSADAIPLPDPTAFTAVVLDSQCPTSADDSDGDGVSAAFGAAGVSSAAGTAVGAFDSGNANAFTWSPSLGFLRSVYTSCNLCVGICG